MMVSPSPVQQPPGSATGTVAMAAATAAAASTMRWESAEPGSKDKQADISAVLLPGPVRKLLPGAAHAVTMVAVGYPFDTVKTRLMLRLSPGMLECARDVIRTNGALGFYRGCAMPLASLVSKRPFEFAVFEWFNARFENKPGVSFLGGCIAGAIGAVAGCPFSVVRVQMQASSKEVHTNSARAILAVWNSRGLLGFYHGLGASVLMQAPYATVYLGTYGQLRETLPKSGLSTALSGGAASLMTCTLLQPLDTVRTLIQARAIGPQEKVSWMTQARMVVQERGPLGLWAGWGPSALRSLPTSAASMLVYEKARSLCDSLPPDK
ncbi:unnamed protein product [Polarella glacialis]|uniref:Mitochondrial carrier protein n=1 Tax=Polarella glacialis TaxID=89957 RepID=A0A813DPS5_POLGL|nr:unnamed protein product [Polarella glacialis]|mmetsp:Transcript_5855/g.9328  ORF Transcript_5855/g.9328 Transcript_5855/m.9328 type:complete len:323 (-) Transcript_5855:135-1103(-)